MKPNRLGGNLGRLVFHEWLILDLAPVWNPYRDWPWELAGDWHACLSVVFAVFEFPYVPFQPLSSSSVLTICPCFRLNFCLRRSCEKLSLHGVH